VVRKDNARFHLELTPPLDLPRDAKGEIDVQGAMQAMTRVVEEWVRDNPGQWLWMHRRWRPNMLPKPKVAPPKQSDPSTAHQGNVTSVPSEGAVT
jgi:KDO2-lipid IV(A) lauroyltransferase